MSRIFLKDNVTLCRADGSSVKFHIKAHIGSGASCVVYHAVCDDNNEHLLKEYYPRNLDLERADDCVFIVPEHKREVFDKGLQRFRNGNERQKAVRLSENLKNFTSNVQGYFYGNGTEYIDMTVFAGRTYSKVENETLHDLMLRMKTLAQVIGYYHDEGLLHLDIKPDNIFVRPENETVEDVMLFDFDSVIEKSDKMTVPALSYTKDWAAPEQLLPYKRNSICEATDLFSIGEIIFTKIFGRHSTQAERRSFAEYDIDYSADIFKNVNPKVVPLIKELFRHTLCAVPARRYQTASELIKQLDKIVALSDPKEPFIKKGALSLAGFFTGRDAEIEAIHEKFKETDTIFLSGIGGIGKSELAKHYAKTYENEYDAIIFAPFVNDVQMMITDDNYVPIYNFSQYPEEKPDEYFARKMRKLGELCDKRTLIIVDNLDTTDDENMDKLFALGCKMLVTTRSDFSDVYSNSQIDIDVLADPFAVFNEYYKKPLLEDDRKCVDEIIEIVCGHTMTVELLAKQMMAGRVKPEKMLDKLKNGGISNSGKEKVRTAKDGNLAMQSTYDHIQALFDLSKLDENDIYILANLSLIPYTGISTELFHDWCKLEDYEYINRLVVEGWLRYDKERDYISLHPLMRDVCQISCLRINFVSTMIEEIYSLLINKDYFIANEVDTYTQLFLSVVKVLSTNKLESNKISRLYHYVGQFFEDNTKYIELAEDIIEKGLEWDIQNNIDGETLRLSISYYLSVLKTNKVSFGNKNRRAERLNKWYTVYKTNCPLQTDQGEMTFEERISTLSSASIHFSNLLDNENSHIYYHQITDAFEELSTATINELFLSENGCDALCDVACAYEALGAITKAADLYYRIIQASNASKGTIETAYLGLIGAKIDSEEWLDGLYLCDQYYQFLSTYYLSEHKAFLLYYQFSFCCLVNSFVLDTIEDCKLVLPKQLLEVIDVFWKYKHLNDQYYGELTTFDKHFVGGYAHLICGYVLFYLEITAADYEGQETWVEMNYNTAIELLTKANELFEIAGLNEEGHIEHYIDIIKERIKDEN